MKSRMLAACVAALAASPALAQSVTVSVQGPANAEPGDVVQISVYASATLPSSGAFAGYGLDLDVTAGASAVTGFSGADSPIMDIGTLAGTPSGASLEHVVGGQISNIYGLNPGVDKSSPILLFTTNMTISSGAANGTVITVAASVSSPSGGIVMYPDVSAGTNVTAPSSAGTSLSFTSLSITLAPPSACPGDVNGDGNTDVFDFSILSSHFGGPVPINTNGDLNGDAYVDVFDFAILASYFGCNS